MQISIKFYYSYLTRRVTFLINLLSIRADHGIATASYFSIYCNFLKPFCFASTISAPFVSKLDWQYLVLKLSKLLETYCKCRFLYLHNMCTFFHFSKSKNYSSDVVEIILEKFKNPKAIYVFYLLTIYSERALPKSYFDVGEY